MDTAISGKHAITLHGINNQKMKSCGLSVFWPTRLPSWDWPWASSVDGSCAAMQANTGENSYFLRASWSWFKPALLLLLTGRLGRLISPRAWQEHVADSGHGRTVEASGFQTDRLPLLSTTTTGANCNACLLPCLLQPKT